MLERFMSWDRFFPMRAEGLIDIAWLEVVLPSNGGLCPIDGADCEGHDQFALELRPYLSPVLSNWHDEANDRDKLVITQLLSDWGDL